MFTSISFESEPIEIKLAPSDVDEESIPEKIVIPQLGIDLAVDKAEIVGGFWKVFEDRAGWGEGSGVPGKPGNQVIFAHAKEGLFLQLQSIKVGESIYVFTKSGWYNYEVREIKKVYPSQTEVITETDDETLTLYTCSGFRDSKRLIVIAKRV